MSSIRAKLDSIYTDLEANVTHIYQRRNMHIGMDLVYHSCLFYNFNGEMMPGWGQGLFIGDTGVGKSHIIDHLLNHYELGEKVDCKSATEAGIKGACIQNGKKWYLKWGAIPFNDKRLVVLEELKGASEHLIQSLTEMRSSGLARITKAEDRTALARTRLIAISNPRKQIDVAQFPQGILTVKDLIGSEEDVRRFDFALIESKDSIPEDEVARLQIRRPEVEHQYKKDLCKRLILWAWTREPDQIVIRGGALDYILSVQGEMLKKYSDRIPLVARGVLLHKFIKLAIALAARTFSTEDGVNLIVDEHHVQFVYEWLNDIYHTKACQFDEFTRRMTQASTLRHKDILKKQIFAAPDPKSLVEYLQTGHVRYNELKHQCMGWQRDQIELFQQVLTYCRAVEHRKDLMIVTNQCLDWLKTLEFKDMSPPSFMENSEKF